MNEPIISPWVFYGLSLLDGIVAFFLLISMVSFAGIFVLYNEYGEDKFKNSKKALVVFVISFLLFLLIPGQRTVEKMLIAHYCTPATVQQIGDKLEMSTVRMIEKIMNHKREKQE